MPQFPGQSSFAHTFRFAAISSQNPVLLRPMSGISSGAMSKRQTFSSAIRYPVSCQKQYLQERLHIYPLVVTGKCLPHCLCNLATRAKHDKRLDGLNKDIDQWDTRYYMHNYNTQCHGQRMTELDWPDRKSLNATLHTLNVLTLLMKIHYPNRAL